MGIDSLLDLQVTKVVLYEKLLSAQYSTSTEFRGFYSSKYWFLKIKKSIETFDLYWGIIDQMPQTRDAERVLFNELKELRESYLETQDSAISEYDNGDEGKSTQYCVRCVCFQGIIATDH